MIRTELSIRRKIMTAIMLTSITVLVVTVVAFMTYDLVTFRGNMVRNLSTLGRIVANNSTAALAFKNEQDAEQILSSLHAEEQVVSAALYDANGKIFATYPAKSPAKLFPPAPEIPGHRFESSRLILFEAVEREGSRMGTLCLQANLTFFYRRLEMYAALATLITLSSLVVAMGLSHRLQKNISGPVLALADTARMISERRDFSVRAPKLSGDELGLLTDAFNQMLMRIEEQTTALQDNEERLRLALQAAHTGTWDWNLISNKVSWDAQNFRLFGRPPGQSDISYEEFLEAVHPDDREQLNKVLQASLAEKKEFIAEYRSVRADGSVHYLFSRGRPFYDPEGQPTRMVGVTVDITERKISEEARLRLAAIVEFSDDAIISKDVNGIISSWNVGAERLFGYKAEEIIGQSMTLLIPPDRYNEEPDFLQRIAAGGSVEHYETVRRRKDGSLIDVSVTVSPIKDAAGRIIGASHISRDITERKRAEEQTRQMNMELERRVQARTAELTAANQEMEAFTYSVAHDLRAPLRHIDAFSKILEDDFSNNLEPDALRYLQTIRRGSQNMSHLVDDLLNLARVGRQELKHEITPLNPLIQEVIAELERETKNRHIEWHIGRLPTVNGDPGLLKQVFVNLISNAIKYTRPRADAVIDLGVQKANGESIFYIRDNGVGFNMKYADKLFGVFQRLHRAEEFEGTGVGLAIVDRVIRRHGGRIWAESELNHGATFYFTLNGMNPKPGA